MNYLLRARELAGVTLYEMPSLVPVSVVRWAHYETGLEPAPAELLTALLDCPRFSASAPVLALHALLASGMSQRDVALAVGVTDSEVSRWMHGRRLVPPERAEALLACWRETREPARVLRVVPAAPGCVLGLALEANQAEQGRLAELEQAVQTAMDRMTESFEENSRARAEDLAGEAMDVLRRAL